MATHLDDEEELENLKRWFKENWVALAAGLVIGFGAIGGWQAWKGYQEKQALTASQMYDDLKKALTASKPDEAKSIADKLQSDHAGSPYASAAALRLAQVAVVDKDYDGALKRLDWVAEHGDEDGLKQLAQLRKARVLWQQSKPDDALKLLDGDAGEYASLYAELRGDIAYSRNDRDSARKAYQAALDKAPEAAANRALLQQKLDDLAVEAAAADPVKS
ncbi:YfgM family protein [Hydrocarboniphaga sp.]|uniref:YfgM family protein n=1 Tax=Hydrocarboniphaga sp. TaxID=2033016 RepID=UPI003D12F950